MEYCFRPFVLKTEFVHADYFAIAPDTDYHKLRASNNTNLVSYSCESQKSKANFMGLKTSISRAVLLLEALGEKLFLCLFHLLEVIVIPWLIAPPLSSEFISPSPVFMFTSFGTLTHMLPSYKDLCVYFGPLWIT